MYNLNKEAKCENWIISNINHPKGIDATKREKLTFLKNAIAKDTRDGVINVKQISLWLRRYAVSKIKNGVFNYPFGYEEKIKASKDLGLCLSITEEKDYFVYSFNTNLAENLNCLFSLI